MDSKELLLEKELTYLLKEEYSFYQSLYVMLDRQKDLIRFDNDSKLLEVFSEVERCHLRIKKSQQKLDKLRDKNPEYFENIMRTIDIRRLANSIKTLVKKCMKIISDCEEYVRNRYNRIQDEMGLLKSSEKILKYINSDELPAELIDGQN